MNDKPIRITLRGKAKELLVSLATQRDVTPTQLINEFIFNSEMHNDAQEKGNGQTNSI